jgi:hypothetical protein
MYSEEYLSRTSIFEWHKGAKKTSYDKTMNGKAVVQLPEQKNLCL